MDLYGSQIYFSPLLSSLRTTHVVKLFILIYDSKSILTFICDYLMDGYKTKLPAGYCDQHMWPVFKMTNVLKLSKISVKLTPVSYQIT